MGAYKVVLVFNLTAGSADEELRRSASEDSFPNRLSRQPGFLSMELVKVGAERTLSIQTWASDRAFFSALEAVKAQPASALLPSENILVSREFFGGEVVARFPA